MEGSEDELRVESFEPAQSWNEALPLGSGRLGAMVFGGVKSELVQLNGERTDILSNPHQTFYFSTAFNRLRINAC